MRKVVLALFVITCLVSSPLRAADAAWGSDFEAALLKAKKSGKPLLVDFTGSDWCKWCIKLHKEVFSTEAFVQWSQKSLELVVIDFPMSVLQRAEVKMRNENLARIYGVQAFPTILILDSNGRLLERTGYREGGAAAYIKHLEEIVAKVKK